MNAIKDIGLIVDRNMHADYLQSAQTRSRTVLWRGYGSPGGNEGRTDPTYVHQMLFKLHVKGFGWQ